MGGRPETYDHLRSKKKPHYQKVTLALDPEVAEQFEEAQGRVRDARLRSLAKPDDEQLQEDLLAAEKCLAQIKPLMGEASVEFIFRSMGRKKYEDLVMANPPTPEQIEQAKLHASLEEIRNGQAVLHHNPDSFPVALISRCLVSPKMSEDEVKNMWDSDDWTGAELMTLFFAAQSVNIKRSQVDLGKE